MLCANTTGSCPGLCTLSPVLLPPSTRPGALASLLLCPAACWGGWAGGGIARSTEVGKNNRLGGTNCSSGVPHTAPSLQKHAAGNAATAPRCREQRSLLLPPSPRRSLPLPTPSQQARRGPASPKPRLGGNKSDLSGTKASALRLCRRSLRNRSDVRDVKCHRVTRWQLRAGSWKGQEGLSESRPCSAQGGPQGTRGPSARASPSCEPSAPSPRGLSRARRDAKHQQHSTGIHMWLQTSPFCSPWPQIPSTTPAGTAVSP